MSQPDEVKAVAPCDKSSISGHREGQDAQRPAHELFDKTDNSYLQSDRSILWIIVDRYRCSGKYLQKVFMISSLSVVFLFHLLLLFSVFGGGDVREEDSLQSNCFLWKHGRRITGDDLLFFAAVPKFPTVAFHSVSCSVSLPSPSHTCDLPLTALTLDFLTDGVSQEFVCPKALSY